MLQESSAQKALTEFLEDGAQKRVGGGVEHEMRMRESSILPQVFEFGIRNFKHDDCSE